MREVARKGEEAMNGEVQRKRALIVNGDDN